MYDSMVLMVKSEAGNILKYVTLFYIILFFFKYDLLTLYIYSHFII